MDEHADLLALAVACATDAAALVAGRTTADVNTKSTPTDMVTDVDRASEALIVGRLLAARPDDGVLGEEGAARPGTSGVVWLIDPIDGTTNFIYDFPAYAVSIAAQRDGTTVAGVVVDATRGETFTATLGGGAHCNGRPLRVQGATTLSDALVATGFSYAAERRRRQAEMLVHVIGEIRDIRRAGSAALDLCWVAAGRLDGAYEAGLQPWDRAAGELIASEAGAWVGQVRDTGVAVVPQLAAALTALLETA